MARNPVILTLWAVAANVVALVVGYLGVAVLWAVLSDAAHFEHYNELFARLYVCTIVAAVLLYAWRRGELLFDGAAPRWLRLAMGWLLAGFVASALDPFNAISFEDNVVKYFTAGFLLAAAYVLARGAIGKGFHLIERLGQAGVAVLFTLAAIDELFELHEEAGEALSHTQETIMTVDSQDFLTLFVGVAGIFFAVMVYAGLKFLMNFTRFEVSRRYELSIYVFCAACLVFLTAMMLDSFDWVVEEAINATLRTFFFGTVQNPTYAFLDEQNLIIRAANSLEEFLELTAAMLFFVMAKLFNAPRAATT